MPEEDARQQPRALTGPQRALYDVLSKLNPSLATMYDGALQALAQAGNPERHAQCAHSLRELMDKLPKYMNVPVKAQNEKMSDKVEALKKPWSRAKQGVCHADGSWVGTIDDALRAHLKRVDEFLDWVLKHRPRRKHETALVLRQFDVSGRQLPGALEELNVKRWMEIREYVVNICHHNSDADEDEFPERLAEFESFVREKLLPEPFVDFDTLDKLLSGDGNA